ncbi:MAG: nucleotidyltransferase domain-containing protein [bacterium]|nr:nucleotidyltransferase domain-containing protein [bacterium]
MKAQQIIDQMVAKISAKFDPEKIILFGSYARGDQTADSDVDLLVIMSFVESHYQKIAEIYGELGAMGISKDILVITPEEVQEFGDVIGTTLRSALREGKVMYERRT